MKTTLGTRTADTPGLFRVGIFRYPTEDTCFGGVIVAWLMRNGQFEMPTSAAQAKRIAEYPRAKAERELERAASVARFVMSD